MAVIGPRKQLNPGTRYTLYIFLAAAGLYLAAFIIAGVTSLSVSTAAAWMLLILVVVFIVGVIVAAIKGVPYR